MAKVSQDRPGSGWFMVDKAGLSQTLARRGKAFVLLELVQNAWDETGVTHVDVSLEPLGGREGLAHLTVVDDAPDGFADLAHAYTLFAPSLKKGDPERRGRFNLGEKLVLALCEEATITSTTGGVRFDTAGRQLLDTRRERGSCFEATIRMAEGEVAEAVSAMLTLLPPTAVTTSINGTVVAYREPMHSFTATLPTEAADAGGDLRRTARRTVVNLYEPLAGEVATLYELGIPVVPTGDRWHYDVRQKVPLTLDRDNVRPSYLRTLRIHVVNHAADRLVSADASATWAREALADERVDDHAVETILTRFYGQKRVAYDPTDAEANKRAVAQGYKVVDPNELGWGAYGNARRAGALKPAGEVTPSPKVVLEQPAVPRDEWTKGQVRVADYAARLGEALLGFRPTVEFHLEPDKDWAAAWHRGRRRLAFNVSQLGTRWFDRPQLQRVDALLMHEFAHARVDDHLSEDYHEELCRLGAKLRTVEVEI